MGRLCFSIYAVDMKECDASELNSTTAEVSLMKTYQGQRQELPGLLA
jgi:hypothetical protein